MKVVILTGSRKWKDFAAIWEALEDQAPDLVVHGGCKSGADKTAELWCASNDVDTHTFRAKWGSGKTLDRSAGPKRNTRMLKAYPGAIVLAFPMGGGGTEDCIKKATAAGMVCITDLRHCPKEKP